VHTLASILFGDEKGNVVNKSRFDEEFTGGELFMPKKNPKPEDFEQLFAGNVDDNFRIGLNLTKKCLKVIIVRIIFTQNIGKLAETLS